MSNTKLEKIVFGTHISVPDNGLIIIPANGIAVGMALAINGDYEADDSFYVVGVWTDNNIIKVKLSKNDIRESSTYKLCLRKKLALESSHH